MKRRDWDNKTKCKIVMEGLQGRSVASICNEYEISQSMYYRWRDTFMENASTAFEVNAQTRRKNAWKENNRLKQLIGDLHLELKKNDW